MEKKPQMLLIDPANELKFVGKKWWKKSPSVRRPIRHFLAKKKNFLCGWTFVKQKGSVAVIYRFKLLYFVFHEQRVIHPRLPWSIWPAAARFCSPFSSTSFRSFDSHLCVICVLWFSIFSPNTTADRNVSIFNLRPFLQSYGGCLVCCFFIIFCISIFRPDYICSFLGFVFSSTVLPACLLTHSYSLSSFVHSFVGPRWLFYFHHQFSVFAEKISLLIMKWGHLLLCLVHHHCNAHHHISIMHNHCSRCFFVVSVYS